MGIIALVAIGYFYAYARASASMWSLHTKDESPYFITVKPIMVNNILPPQGTKIKYKKRHFWEKNEQEKPLKEKDVVDIIFKAGVTINWGGLPTKFSNQIF